jgi:hypothetical protein
MQNAITYKAFGNLAKNDSGILKEFKACMYDYEDELKFHEAWYTFLYKYKVDGNTWAESICRKEKFAHCSMKKAYTIGMCSTQGPRMCSTQLSESFNSH